MWIRIADNNDTIGRLIELTGSVLRDDPDDNCIYIHLSWVLYTVIFSGIEDRTRFYNAFVRSLQAGITYFDPKAEGISIVEVETENRTIPIEVTGPAVLVEIANEPVPVEVMNDSVNVAITGPAVVVEIANESIPVEVINDSVGVYVGHTVSVSVQGGELDRVERIGIIEYS